MTTWLILGPKTVQNSTKNQTRKYFKNLFYEIKNFNCYFVSDQQFGIFLDIIRLNRIERNYHLGALSRDNYKSFTHIS